MISENSKIQFKNILLELARIQRVHIIGCSRSGTTMLHYVMSAFQNTKLYDQETSLWNYPSVKASFKLFISDIFNSHHTYLVSKRNAGWQRKENIYRLVEHVIKYNVYLIYIIRDPRDVLTSTHKLDKNQYYVSIEFWKKSMESGEKILELLDDYQNKLVVRYEDVVEAPSLIEEQLKNKFGLIKRSRVKSIRNLKDNMEQANLSDSQMVSYMHELRNLDINSIGKWRNDELKKNYLESLYHDETHSSYLKKIAYKYKYT